MVDDHNPENSRNRLRLLPESPAPINLLEVVTLVEAPATNQPFRIDAKGIEEDTSLVLSAEVQIRDPRQHPIRLMTELYEHQAKTPGTIVVKQANPVRLLAIVHDFDQDPSCREEWIKACLDEILEHCNRQRFESLGLEGLGTIHGRLSVERFQRLLHTSLHDAPLSSLKRIWLVR